jgi:glucose/arabinose dehydrogenase
MTADRFEFFSRTSRRLGTALVCAGVSLTASTTLLAQPQASSVQSFTVETVVDGLVNPWSMTWLPNGDMLVTEKAGSLRLVRDGRLLPDPVAVIDDVRDAGQGGLHEVVLHPDFASNGLVYLSYARGNADMSLGTTALVRGRLRNDRLVDIEDIFEAKAWANTPGHFGARVAFDDDGHLFMSVGDRMAGFEPGGFTKDVEGHPAQDPSNHQGTIIRLNDDGSVPEDNPFVGREGFLPEIWSYGHRNPQGLAFDPETGFLWETEHGPQGGDELNHILPGRHYGWPVIGYGANYNVGTEIHPARNREGMEQPAAFWVPSIATSGLAVYHGDAFENWEGNLFVGGMSPQHRRLSRVMLNGDVVTNREPLLQGVYRIRDVRVGPDGLIYIATDNQYGNPTPVVRLVPNDE